MCDRVFFIPAFTCYVNSTIHLKIMRKLKNITVVLNIFLVTVECKFSSFMKNL